MSLQGSPCRQRLQDLLMEMQVRVFFRDFIKANLVKLFGTTEEENMILFRYLYSLIQFYGQMSPFD